MTVLSGGNIYASNGSVGDAVYIESALSSFTNYGTIRGGTGSGSNGISIGSGGNVSALSNYGTITSSGTAPTVFVQSGSTLNSLTNQSAGTISNTGGGPAVELNGLTSNSTITNYGSISSSNGHRAIYVTGGSGTTTIVNEGAVTGGSGQKTPTETSSGSGVMVDTDVTGAVTITNRGTIVGGAEGTNYSAGTAVDVGSSGSITVNNYGTLSAGAAGSFGNPRIALTFDLAGAAATFNNYGGTLNGGIGLSTHGDQINFYGGTLNGSIYGMATSGGAMNGTGADIYFRSGTTTVNGDIGKAFGTTFTSQGQTAYVGPVNSVTLSDGATLAFGQDTEIHAGASSIINGGTFDLGTYKVTYNHYDAMNVSESFSGTLYMKTTINANTGKHGYWIFTKASGPVDTTMFSNGVPTIVPTVVGTVATGSKYIVIQDTDGRTVVNLPSVINSGSYRWTVSTVTGAGQTDTDGVSYGTGYSNIIITNSGSNAAGSASGTNGAGVKAIASYSGSNSAMTALSNAVNNLTSAAEIEKAGAQLRPSANGATTQAALGAVGQAVNTISVRTDSVRAASAETGGGTGVSSGEMLRGLGVWTQAFGSVANQDRRLGGDGYTADTYGVAFGADAKVAEPLRLGLSFAYARTGVDDAGSREGSGQTINSYIGSLYGTYTANRWYVDGALTYGHHTYDGIRVINVTGAARQTAKSSYGGNQYGAKAELGVPFAVGAGITLTPLAGIAYNHLRQDGYTEKDAAAALTVGSSNTDSIKSSLGVKAAATVAQWREWNVRPNARAVWSHEFNTKAHDQTSAYVDGGSSFTNTGTDAASESFTLGIGLDLASVRNTTLSAKYDAGLSDRYVSHTGSLQARMEF
ncbi:autotransporter domain-containing protein [Magnetospirillum sp. XM-1]|uniref:autotransporter outer membrane beta-barrel domain-containing protein n=1 Tax=Magnetospirillum sp. XM-1 TaxID=1663591 RepID=UPI00083910E9|nr:autotransporter outer membrane beta-barrel domain-containing protein [Magnetospirillum sp. XM-1]